MAAHKRIFNIDRNCFYDRSVIILGIENCAITWVEEGISVRDTTNQERISLRAAQAQEASIREFTSGILGRNELLNVKFVPPKTTKYRAPREAYEEMESPLCVRSCRWPRPAFVQAEWPSKAHVDQALARLENGASRLG